MGLSSYLIAGLILFPFLGACHPSRTSSSASSSTTIDKNQPDQKMEKLHLQSYGPEGLEWELTAPLGEGFSGQGQTNIKNLTVHLYSHSKKASTVTADEGIVFNGPSEGAPAFLSLSALSLTLYPGDMFLNGNVVMVSTEGQRMKTDWAHYKKKADLIVSTAPVEVVREDSITKGFGMEATPDLSSVKIFKETLVIPSKKMKYQ